MNANSTSTFSYAKTARQRAPAQATPAHSTMLDIRNSCPSSNPRSCSSNTDARVIARLPTSHPLRGEDTLLVRTKLRQLPDRPELIKDVRIFSTGLALVAPSRNLVPDLLLAAEKLQMLLGNVPLERQEKRINFPLGPVPKYGYNCKFGKSVSNSLLELNDHLSQSWRFGEIKRLLIVSCRVVN
ncbi:hypothetical protein K3495_g11609 [Podosphaera aphanis]|nr:hypothetical protein K3495_g11609 [Podosphaera aphanis]